MPATQLNPLLTPIAYEQTAYRSDQIPLQPRASILNTANVDLDFLGSEPLPWGNPQDIIPITFMLKSKPGHLRKLSKSYILQGFHLEKNARRFDNLCIRSAQESKAAKYCGMIYHIGRYLMPLTCIMMLIVLLSFWFFTSVGFIELLLIAQNAMLLFIALPLAMWLLSLLCSEVFHWPLDHPLYRRTWEFNRHTGMVTLYDDHWKKHLAYRRPFIEFDAYVLKHESKNKKTRYQLALKNRYNGMKITGIFKQALPEKQEIWAMWDFLQCYMDTSKPLPDDGRLEIFRPFDLTTVHTDQANARPPRYWRDMPETVWETELAKMQNKIKYLSISERKDIMKPHFVDDTFATTSTNPETVASSIAAT